jgi:hypothetical protein
MVVPPSQTGFYFIGRNEAIGGRRKSEGGRRKAEGFSVGAIHESPELKSPCVTALPLLQRGIKGGGHHFSLFNLHFSMQAKPAGLKAEELKFDKAVGGCPYFPKVKKRRRLFS